MPLYRKYISAVTPLPDYILRVDFVSGSRLLLDNKPLRVVCIALCAVIAAACAVYIVLTVIMLYAASTK